MPEPFEHAQVEDDDLMSVLWNFFDSSKTASQNKLECLSSFSGKSNVWVNAGTNTLG